MPNVMAFWYEHRLLVTLIWFGAACCVPAGVLLAAGYSRRPSDGSLVLTGWLLAASALVLLVTANHWLQRARTRERGDSAERG